jgi:hypothetical protein
MTTDGRKEREMQADIVVVERRLVGAIRGQEVHLRDAGAGAIAAGGDVTITNGGCGPVALGGNLSITNGGCGPVFAGGNASIERGGSQTMIAGGEARIGEHARVGIVLSPQVTVEEGGSVLLSTPQALAFGAAVGASLAVVLRLLRR